ncbi:hypothetical protein PoB_005070800 [Plakobranchus ocellatus]|uniref:Uncharacterized protein n=1 Tax=Plakobranchus ocellatus TaxID=259542 RepID=A0AAV4BX30_9GAST|nr:hypothetical protein PoB_005070800 [Plakobranchus ocellatus]
MSDIWPDSVLVKLLVPNILSDLIRVATILEQLMCVLIALDLGMAGKIVSSCKTSLLKLFWRRVFYLIIAMQLSPVSTKMVLCPLSQPEFLAGLVPSLGIEVAIQLQSKRTCSC